MQFSSELTNWLQQYGSIALFVMLALGIIALPVPDESLMVFSGLLIAQHKLNFFSTLAAAYAGSLSGITISYLIGKSLGYYLLEKYGLWVGVTHARLQKAHAWFEKIGKWGLLFGYFIPGIRHFTGYTAGVTRLSYQQFALFAYCGGIIWVSLFLSIGYFLGNQLDQLTNIAKHYWYGGIILFVILIVIFSVIKFRSKK